MSPNASAKPPKPRAAGEAAAPRETRRRIDACVAELVVRRALARVAQDLVGLLRFLEFLFGRLSSGLRSGGCFIASLRYDFLMSSSRASRVTPRTV
jgi:hypothetical protein